MSYLEKKKQFYVCIILVIDYNYNTVTKGTVESYEVKQEESIGNLLLGHFLYYDINRALLFFKKHLL